VCKGTILSGHKANSRGKVAGIIVFLRQNGGLPKKIKHTPKGMLYHYSELCQLFFNQLFYLQPLTMLIIQHDEVQSVRKTADVDICGVGRFQHCLAFQPGN
jgi:hypothetical protein